MAERANSEEGKASSSLYALNPISRRYVLKTSDVYLRLLKSGVVSDPETMEALDLRKREASRARQRGAAAKLSAAVKPEPKPEVAPSAKPKPAPKKPPDRAEVRRRVIQTALDHQSELDGCEDDDELEERLRRLLRPSRRATQTPTTRGVRQFADRYAVSDDDDDGDGTDTECHY